MTQPSICAFIPSGLIICPISSTFVTFLTFIFPSLISTSIAAAAILFLSFPIAIPRPTPSAFGVFQPLFSIRVSKTFLLRSIILSSLSLSISRRKSIASFSTLCASSLIKLSIAKVLGNIPTARQILIGIGTSVFQTETDLFGTLYIRLAPCPAERKSEPSNFRPISPTIFLTYISGVAWS